ncbi:hypothetical protein CHS0354_028382 [Potamilus streckersoni]|uniref:Protogenin n=1 Tax=Potamilus streckersoni TaxID=2493646 RepID=A0AAE0RTY5_9BIVA|nr:hypothetical protein CHS0354_028382 [Potamilus streckersoni]
MAAARYFCYFLLCWSICGFKFGGAYKNNSLDLELSIQQDPQVVFATHRLPFMLNCSVFSQDAPLTFRWIKDGKPLKNNKHTFVSVNGSLFFSKVIHRPRKGRSDEGLYECFANNKNGTVLGRRVRVKIPSHDSSTVTVEPQNVVVSQGSVIRLECLTDSTPKPIYMWEKVNGQLPLQDRVVEFEGVLQIYNVQPEDEGQYNCKVAQGLGEEESRVAFSWISSHKVNVTITNVEFPFQFRQTPVNVTALVGGSAYLECLLEGGNSSYSLSWQTQDGRKIVEKDFSVSFVGNLNLRFAQVAPSDSGIYICVAERPGFVSLKRHYQLEVIVPPYFTMTPQSYKYPVAQKVRFHCEAGGTPQPNITWYKDGRKIVPSSSSYVTGSRDNLLIVFGNEDDSGYYQCLAENIAGYVMATARLQMILKRNTPQKPKIVSAEALSDTQILLVWEEPDSCCQIIAYTLEYNKLLEDDEKEVSKMEISKNTSIVIENLKPFTNYSVRVRAYTVVGAGPLSDTVFIRTKSSVPTSVPLVTLQNDSPASIIVSWTLIPQEHRNGIITRYKLYYGTGKLMETKELPVDIRTYVLTGLMPDTEYKVRVLAGTDVGYPSLPEEEMPFATQKTSAFNTTVLPTPSLLFWPINSTAVEVSWEIDNQLPPVELYLLTVKKIVPSGLSLVLQKTLTPVAYNTIIDNLENGSFYQVTLMIESQQSAPTIVTEVYQAREPSMSPKPPPPTHITARSFSSDMIEVSWKRPKTAMEIRNYTVQYVTKTKESNKLEKHSDSLTTMLDGLAPFTWYDIAICSHTDQESGPYSNTIMVQTKEAKPSSPEDIQAVVISPGTVELTWKPPRHENGIIIYYTVYYIDVSYKESGIWNTIQQNASATSLVVSELSKRASFQLRACNRAGEGPPVYIEVDTCPRCLQCSSQYTSCIELYGLASDYNGIFEQKLGIFIGSAVGFVCIILCVTFIVVKHRQLQNQYGLPQTRCTAMNGRVGRYLSQPISSSEEISYSPVLATTKKNETLGTKDDDDGTGPRPGRRVISGIFFPNGVTASIFSHGQVTGITSAEQRALLSPSNSSSGVGGSEGSPQEGPSPTSTLSSKGENQNEGQQSTVVHADQHISYDSTAITLNTDNMAYDQANPALFNDKSEPFSSVNHEKSDHFNNADTFCVNIDCDQSTAR